MNAETYEVITRAYKCRMRLVNLFVMAFDPQLLDESIQLLLKTWIEIVKD